MSFLTLTPRRSQYGSVFFEGTFFSWFQKTTTGKHKSIFWEYLLLRWFERDTNRKKGEEKNKVHSWGVVPLGWWLGLVVWGFEPLVYVGKWGFPPIQTNTDSAPKNQLEEAETCTRWGCHIHTVHTSSLLERK